MKWTTPALITLLTLAGCSSNPELENLRAENQMLRDWLEQAILAEDSRVLTGNELAAVKRLQGHVKTMEKSMMRTEEHLAECKKKNIYFSLLNDDQWERIRKITNE